MLCRRRDWHPSQFHPAAGSRTPTRDSRFPTAWLCRGEPLLAALVAPTRFPSLTRRAWMGVSSADGRHQAGVFAKGFASGREHCGRGMKAGVVGPGTPEAKNPPSNANRDSAKHSSANARSAATVACLDSSPVIANTPRSRRHRSTAGVASLGRCLSTIADATARPTERRDHALGPLAMRFPASHFPLQHRPANS